jgi:DNA-binding response OmpR family regulator
VDREFLIIDDDIDTCVLLNLFLKTKNIKSLYVNSLSEAKVVFNSFKPKGIFLDNQLPDGLGMDFVRYIKSIFPDVPIIMVTAHNNSRTRRLAYEMGVMYFLGKPFDKNEISYIIDNTFNS